MLAVTYVAKKSSGVKHNDYARHLSCTDWRRVAVNDRIVTNVDDVHRLLAAIPTNANVDLTIVRDQSKKA